MTNRASMPGGGLPDEIEAVHAELSSIRYEERPSFGPELEAELALEWTAVRSARGSGSGSRARLLAAAGVTGLLLAGLAVPSARAAIVKLVGIVAELEAPELPTPDAPAAAVVVGTSDERPEDVIEAPPTVALPPAPADEAAPGVVAPTAPELVDRAVTEALIRRHYPMDLQREGVGGTVRLHMWVDPAGLADHVTVVGSSGIGELDRAVLNAAPWFRFRPGQNGGEAMGTWVAFDVHFEPGDAPRRPGMAEVPPLVGPAVLFAPGRAGVPLWDAAHGGAASTARREAEELLRAALGDEDLIERLGPMEAILEGSPPSGAGPTRWRVSVTAALEEATARAPENPAPLLALGRIRLKQGLRTDARLLFERGLERALRAGGAVSPRLLAELHYERGTLVKGSWLASWRLGRVSAEALPASRCPQARSSGGAASGYASVERLIAWNYLCPAELHRVLDDHFEGTSEGRADLAVMTASFEMALEAHPAHVGANAEILLAHADEGRWEDVLRTARRFEETSGHPLGALFGGLALQRLARSEEAAEAFARALDELPPPQAERLRDVQPLLDAHRLGEYRALSDADRRAWEAAFWATLDPIASTAVNEREIEHLARTAYAELRLGGVGTDAGRVWVRYGRPDRIRAVGEGPELRTELWDYGSSGPDVTFNRLASGGTLELTPEGRAYVDELREVYPHRYGTWARVVIPLPAEVTRSRDAEEGTLRMRVRAAVPDALATGGSDLLELGVFLVGPDGKPRRQSRRTMRAVPGPIEIEAVVAPSATAVVVELFHPGTGQTASLVEGVHAPGDGELRDIEFD